MSNKPKVKLKTLQLEYKGCQKKILNNMMTISKNIYNCCIYTNNIFSIYKNQIYKIIYDEVYLIKNKESEIINYDIINRFSELFNHYYNIYTKNKELIKINNNIIFQYTKNKANNIILNNTNINIFIKELQDNIVVDYTVDNKNLVYDNIILKIVKYYYDKYYFKTRDELLHHKPLTYNDIILIQNVKDNEYYFQDTNINYKIKIINDFNKDIKSDQTIFKDMVYAYSLGNNKEKLPADITLNLINKYYEAIKSYYAKLELKMKACKPKYLDKDSKFSLFYYPSSFKIVNNKARLTIGKYHSDRFNDYQMNSNILHKIDHRKYCIKNNIVSKSNCKKKKLFLKIDKGYINKKKIIDANYTYLNLPKKIKNNNIKLIQIKSYGNKIIVNISYEEEIIIIKNKTKIDYKLSVSIDPGINNLLTIYNPTGTQHIIKGRKLKSMNEFYNKKIGELQSINKKKYDKNMFNRLYSLLDERKNKINGEINKIVNLLIKTYNDKIYFILGYNESWKLKVNLGTKTNRIFYNIPYQRIIDKLKTKLESLGKELIVKEESYTSKCDSLNLEDVKKQDTYSGIRKHRGLFISKIGKAINADLNGAINIMRKVIKLKEIKGVGIYNPTILA